MMRGDLSSLPERKRMGDLMRVGYDSEISVLSTWAAV